jgi:hypothetical protein
MVAFRLGRSSISHRVHLANSSNARPTIAINFFVLRPVSRCGIPPPFHA